MGHAVKSIKNTAILRSILLAMAYSAFYPTLDETPSNFALMGAMSSLLTNVLDPRQVSQDGQLSAAFRETSMDMVVDTYTEAEVLTLPRNERVIRFVRMFEGRNLEQYQHHGDQQIFYVRILVPFYSQPGKMLIQTITRVGLRTDFKLSKEHWGSCQTDATG